MSEFEKLFRDGEALKHDLEDYWRGVAGDGDLGYEWRDKPHRLVFDLISGVLYERYRARAWEELHAKDTELLAAEGDRWKQLAEKRHELGLSMVDKLEKAEARADEWASMYESIKLDTYKVALQRDEARACAEKAEAALKDIAALPEVGQHFGMNGIFCSHQGYYEKAKRIAREALAGKGE